MIEWRRITCAVDFAEPSRVAMQEAADLARRFGAELTLVHSVVPPPPAASDVLVSSRELSAISAEESGDLLERWRAEAEARAGRPVRSRLLRGDPAAEVVRDARDERCDVLVVGTHGRTGLARVLGSVAERVAREATCPVLVLHDHVTLAREGRVAEPSPSS